MHATWFFWECYISGFHNQNVIQGRSQWAGGMELDPLPLLIIFYMLDIRISVHQLVHNRLKNNFKNQICLLHMAS